MELFEQQDDKSKRKSKIRKLLRQMKHREERRASKRLLGEHSPTYRKYKGWEL